LSLTILAGFVSYCVALLSLYAVVLGIGTIIGASFGAKLSLQTHPGLIKKVIALCLFLLALRLITNVL